MSQRQIFRISDLSGGLNPDQSPLLIADNEAAEAVNVRIDKIGSLVSRKGYSRYVDLVSPSEIFAIGRWRNQDSLSDTDVLASTAAGNIVYLDDSGEVYTTLLSGLSTTARGMFLPVGQDLLYTDGVDAIVAYDGTNIGELGEDAPAVAPGEVVNVGVGSLTIGDYTYRYTYYSSSEGWESNPSPISDVATAAGADRQVTLTLVESTNAFFDKIRIYRTTPGGATHLLLATINSSTTYVDDGSVALSALEVSTNNNRADNFENIAYHKGYLFGSIGDRVYWSSALDFSAFPTTNSTRVPFEGNDTIVALKSFQDTLIIFGHHNTILLVGDGGNWSLIREDVEIGCASRNAIAEVENSLIFLSHEALHVYPGFQQFCPKLTRTLSKNFADRTTASLVAVPEERSVWLSLAGETWAIHVVNQGISKYSFYAKQFLRGGDSGNGYPLWIDSTGTYVNETGGTLDIAEPIAMRWVSKVFQLANPEFVKFFRRLGAFATTGAEASVTVTIGDTQNQYTVTLSTAGEVETSNWGEFNWDQANWSSEGFTYFIGSLPAQSLIGRTFQVTINAATTTETEIISPITFEFRESNRFLGV